MALNARQKRFCDEYLIDKNAVQAAIRAGYSKVTAQNASRWLDPGSTEKYNGEMWSYIHEQLERIHSEKTADAKEVLEYLTSVMRGEHTEETLQLIGDGVQTISDISVSAKDRLKAAELIGKTYGIFTDKTDLNIAQPIVISGGETLED